MLEWLCANHRDLLSFGVHLDSLASTVISQLAKQHVASVTPGPPQFDLCDKAAMYWVRSDVKRGGVVRERLVLTADMLYCLDQAPGYPSPFSDPYQCTFT